MSKIHPEKLSRLMTPAIDSAIQIISLKELSLLTACFTNPCAVSSGITLIL
jgi:hypothetical protein